MEGTTSTTLVTVEADGSTVVEEERANEASFDDLQLVSRLVLGLAMFGGKELIARLRNVQQRLDASGELAGGDTIPDDETMSDVLTYLAVGAAMRGGRRLAQTVKWGLGLSLNTAGWALGTFSRVTDNPVTRPIRRPIDRLIAELMMEGQAAIQDGRREVYVSRKLADETVVEIIDEAVDTLAENPQLTSSIERLVVGQGAGLTETAMGSARELGSSADDLAEGILRRMFRRKPRRELPPSPLAGQPLTMYGPQKPAGGGQDERA
jgi:hypothetical protein